MKLTWRIWLMLGILLLSIISIFGMPPVYFQTGVQIESVDENSTAFEQGLRNGEIITAINEQPISSLEEYSNVVSNLFVSSEETRIAIQTTNNQYLFYTSEPLDLVISEIPKTNIETGLDLQGGARALVVPEEQLTDEEMTDLISVSQERFDVYGISDVKIRSVKDLSGENYMLIEIAGATPSDLETLIGEQGKFEARIGNETVFVGGNKDITYVCRDDATCSGVDQCFEDETGGICSYNFLIFLSEEAATRHADLTRDVPLDSTNPGYLEKTIDFYVDDQLANSLLIAESLKGQVATQIQISGSGVGFDRASAFEAAEEDMKSTQTILITGSLPYKLEIVKLDTISPVLGQRFNNLILLTGLVALTAVAIVVFIRYRNFKAALALIFTSVAELIIILGFATGFGSDFRWVLDLPSIVGILITIGTGVDQQIVILDESRSKKSDNIRAKIKRALFIVMAAYATTALSLIPLWSAGAGLLRGFMVTTIIGLTIGVFITRPAFADMIRLMSEKNASK